jgi:hypothetical protein
MGALTRWTTAMRIEDHALVGATPAQGLRIAALA